ncbi:sensor histidine kinase [Gordonia sp. NPDC003950]
MSRLMPRSLAGQAVALQVAVVVAIVVCGSVLAAVDARADANRAAREEVTAVAVSLADAPWTAAALTSADPTATLQPVTEQIRRATGVAFITIMDTTGRRFTHTTPSLIGQRYIGTTEPSLRGAIYTETYTGTLGPSIRTVAPVRDAGGKVVGLVAVGITQSTLTEDWVSQLPLIATIGIAALVIALIGLWAIRRRLLRHTGGLAPSELRVMYDHHDAVLHAVHEGLIVLEGGKPVLVNDEAHRLLDDGRGGRETAGGDAAVDIPSFLTSGHEPLRDTLYAANGRVLVVNRAPVPGRDDGAVVTIRDRTELSEAVGELDSMTRFAEALRSQAHESGNRLHTMVALIEMGRTEEAVRLATESLEVSQHLVDRIADAVAEPTLAALLLGKSAQAAERGIAFALTEDSMVDDGATQRLSSAEMITVVGNLVDNALDACDPEDPWVEVTVRGDAGGLRIVVADSGGGMSPDVFARAQQRGYSTKAGGDEAGRGIGLALVAQVVAGHGGVIVAENTYGSVVTVEIGSAAAPAVGVGS